MAVTLEALTTEAVLGDYENRVVQLGGQSPVGNSNVGGAPRTWPSAPWGHWEAKEVARAKRMSLILGISLQAWAIRGDFKIAIIKPLAPMFWPRLPC
jgi:hypothetical protein